MRRVAGIAVVVGLFLCAPASAGAAPSVALAKAKIGRDAARTAKSVHTGWAVGACRRQGHRRVVCTVRLRDMVLFDGGAPSDCVQHVGAYERRSHVVLRDLDTIDCTKPPS